MVSMFAIYMIIKCYMADLIVKIEHQINTS